MPGIRTNNVAQFQIRVARFNLSYANDWRLWVGANSSDRPHEFGRILRTWQACRPNAMRRTQAVGQHSAPYLEDLISQSASHIQALQGFDISIATSFNRNVLTALNTLWEIFEELSYRGRTRDGLAGAVGISKAVLLLSDGRVGPAFDSSVTKQLGLGKIKNADAWIAALLNVNQDIEAFETANSKTMRNAAPNYADLHSGRIYDMALGPD